MNGPSSNTFHSPVSRRRFLQRSSAALAGAAMTVGSPFVLRASTAEQMKIKIGLVGCGNRGRGAVLDALGVSADVAKAARTGNKNIEVVALADLFEERLPLCRRQFAKLGIEIPNSRCFAGIDAYQKLLGIAEINYVIFATPPHFRPAHLKAAVEAGKHVFIEKPLTDSVSRV